MKKIVLNLCCLVLTVVVAIGCSKRETIQGSAVLIGTVAGVMLGGNNAGKAIGGAAGAIVGFIVGGWLADNLTEEEQKSLYSEVESELARTPEKSAGEKKWTSRENPKKQVNFEFTKAGTCSEFKPCEPEEANNELHDSTTCREVTLDINESDSSINKQQQIWCRSIAGDYKPIGEPYSAQIKS